MIASDPCTDLAVVHFSSDLPKQAEALIFGSSADVKPGDSVTVLGYPGTLTLNPAEQKLLISSGLVNATKVPARAPGLLEYEDTIQHGATVNYGNSGGPLLDHHGRLVGINTLTNFGSQAQPAQGQFYSISTIRPSVRSPTSCSRVILRTTWDGPSRKSFSPDILMLGQHQGAGDRWPVGACGRDTRPLRQGR